MKLDETSCNAMQPNPPFGKTNPSKPALTETGGRVSGIGVVVVKSGALGAGDAVQPDATPCNLVQPGATTMGGWKNEPTDAVFAIASPPSSAAGCRSIVNALTIGRLTESRSARCGWLESVTRPRKNRR